jgi:hypothetical protein
LMPMEMEMCRCRYMVLESHICYTFAMIDRSEGVSSASSFGFCDLRI